MPKKGNVLGKSLIRDHKKKRTFVNKDGFRHTSDLPDGYDWARLNLHSVTEQSSVDDFLDQVKLAGKEYDEEFSNVEVLSPDDNVIGVPTLEEQEQFENAQNDQKHLLSIPRRPCWQNLTKEELDAKEKQTFLNWRRNIALSRERDDHNLNITPFEKNLEIWRQLWRVVEKSDVVMQIIDARNPLLFRCEDLEIYVKEVDEEKINVLLLNKADFLSEQQRKMWAEYFDSVGVKIIFFSALQQIQSDEIVDGDDCKHVDNQMNEQADGCSEAISKNSYKILSRLELASCLKNLVHCSKSKDGITTIGLVGYPNVGKSSSINAVLLNKKVKVSATPGKTKHFQTIMVDSDLCFCDCPGLVFPKFVATKADMVINGILPIDQLTEYSGPVTLVANLIPRPVLEATYSIMLPKPTEGRDPQSAPTSEELLNAYGYLRGFMTQRGLPDIARISRFILKDFINGKLLHCHPPPGVEDKVYREHSIQQIPEQMTKVFVPKITTQPKGEEIDRSFFKQAFSSAHVKGVKGYCITNPVPQASKPEDQGKPWKKHHNRNKKEKSRRVYVALDQ